MAHYNDYAFEERDDERTWDESLVPDCEKKVEKEVEKKKKSKKTRKEIIDEMDSSALEYVCALKILIDASGKVSYYTHMLEGNRLGVSKMIIVASAYGHELKYYAEQMKDWKYKQSEAFVRVNDLGKVLGYKDYLKSKNAIFAHLFEEDRRKNYKGYLENALRRGKTLSLAELEEKYENLLKKRLKKRLGL